MVVYQDNESCIQMVKNGGAQKAKGKSLHIHRRHFWMKDFVLNGYITLKYMPTEEMIADMFTKPLQSKLFYKFRDALGLIEN